MEYGIQFSNLSYMSWTILNEFLTRNNLLIFVILMNFVSILTSDAHSYLLRIYLHISFNFHQLQLIKDFAYSFQVFCPR